MAEKVDLGEKGSFGVSGKTKHDVLKMMKEEKVELVDAVFTDPAGLWQHCTFMANQLDDEAFDVGLPFDGSSIKLFKVINESDMLMKPDPNTAFIDPFATRKTLHITCSIYEPDTPNTGYQRDPRSIAVRAVEYLRATGIADTAYFGPEAEFFMFDSVQFSFSGNKAYHNLEVEEGSWNSDKTLDGHNLGHRMEPKGYYFPVAPIDRSSDIRGDMLLTMAGCGVPVEKHHHEVAVGQSELGFRALPLVAAADALQTYKYVIKNVALKHGKTVTFMPKPVYGDNGTGMHVHQSLWKDGKPLFWDPNGKYVNLSQMALHYIGGIIHHAPALCAFINSSTNSYKRLVPGFEAPVNLAYSKGNRSAAIRIPMYHPNVPKYKRMEFRCPDALSNPYIAFAACLMAGLDGIKNQISPGAPMDVDIYELDDEERGKIKKTPPNLSAALDALEKDHDFLTQGGVFSKDFIEAYIKSKRAEVTRVDSAPHPLEFILYYHG